MDADSGSFRMDDQAEVSGVLAGSGCRLSHVQGTPLVMCQKCSARTTSCCFVNHDEGWELAVPHRSQQLERGLEYHSLSVVGLECRTCSIVLLPKYMKYHNGRWYYVLFWFWLACIYCLGSSTMMEAGCL